MLEDLPSDAINVGFLSNNYLKRSGVTSPHNHRNRFPLLSLGVREMGAERVGPKLVHPLYSRIVAMHTRVQKWGNRLRVRIPRGLAEEVGLAAGTEVSLSGNGGELVEKAALPTCLTLDDLLAGVSESNLHSSVDTGSAIGAEIF